MLCVYLWYTKSPQKNLENKGKKTKAIVLFNMDVHICIFLGFIWVKILKAPFWDSDEEEKSFS